MKATAIEDILSSESNDCSIRKILTPDGRLYIILPDGKVYNALGEQVQ